jgi:Protein of unknown function (DUF3017)
MANRPANAGAGRAGLDSGLAPTGEVASPSDVIAPRPPAGHRAARPKDEPVVTGVLAWLPYLVVLAGAAAGLFVAAQGTRYAVRGIVVLGGSLLAAALARLILPNRLVGLLASRRKASDVLAFAVLGAAMLAVALSLP